MVGRNISDKHVTKTEDVEVSVVSTLPPGLDEGKYRTADLVEELQSGTEYEEGESLEETETPTDEVPEDSSLDVPKNIYVKEQIFWFGDGGIPFVDVILGFDGSAGAHAYEVRFATE